MSSRPSTPDQLRAQLRAASNADQLGSQLPPGSVWLYTIGCAFLGAPGDDDDPVTQALFELFNAQAEREGVDGDEAIYELSKVGWPP